MRPTIGAGIHFNRQLPPVIWEADFTVLPLSTTTNASELRGRLAALGLTLTRASAATVQTSASTVVTSGIGVDDPRVGDGGYGRGLVLEESRQSALPRSDVSGAGWVSNGAVAVAPTTNTVAGDGPDGGNACDLSYPAVTSGFSIRYYNNVASVAPWAFSSWVKGAVGGERMYLMGTPNGTTFIRQECTLTAAWKRYVAVGTASVAMWYWQIGCDRRDTGQTPTSALTLRAALAQAEAGAWPSELIITTGAAATRQSDRVLLDSAARIVRGGRVTLNARMALKGSIGGSNDYAADPFLWRYDASNYASINRTTGAVTVVIAGASYTTASGFTAARGDVVDYWVEAGGGSLQTVVKARKSTDGGVTFGAVTALGTTSPQGTHPSATSMDLLSNAGSANHLSAWVQRIRAYAPGRRPAWAS